MQIRSPKLSLFGKIINFHQTITGIGEKIRKKTINKFELTIKNLDPTFLLKSAKVSII
jgi:uncharacterized protein YkvS